MTASKLDPPSPIGASASTGWRSPRRALALAVLLIAASLGLIWTAEAPLGAALSEGAQHLEQDLAAGTPPEGCAGLKPLGTLPTDFKSFDGRFLTYSPETGRRILCVMATPEAMSDGAHAREIYLWRHFPLDLLYPAIYAAAGFSALLTLLSALGWRRFDWLAHAPTAAALFDYGENIVVWSLVMAGPAAATEAGLEIASQLTLSKWSLVLLSLGGVVIMLLILLSKWLSRRIFAQR